MKSKLLLLFIFTMTISMQMIPAQQSSDLDILVLYGTQSDNEAIVELLPNSSHINISALSIDVDNVSFVGIDIIIIASSTSFSLEDTIEVKLKEFLSEPNHYLFVFSAYLEDFSGGLRPYFGIDNSNNVIDEENNNTSWIFELQTTISDYSTGDEFEYTGTVGDIELLQDSNILVKATNSTNSDSEVSFPIPVIWNMTSYPVLVNSFIIGNDTETDSIQSKNISTDQLPDFVDTFLIEFVAIYFETVEHEIINNQDDNNPSINTPAINSLYAILIGILAFIILLYRRILEGINWLIRKAYGLLFVIIGAFYNVQDRALNYNEVLMNSSRVEILEFLHHIGQYGAHLREIKSITNMGSGSLLWHLQVLEDFALLEKIKINSYTVFVLNDYIKQFDEELKISELNLQSKYTFPIIALLNEFNNNDKISLSEIENQTNINRRALRRLVKKMEKENLITLERTTSIVVIIQDKIKINKLFQSLRLRNNFEWDENSIQIENVE